MKLYFYDAIVFDNHLWFAADNMNGLFNYDMEQKKVKYITHFDKYEKWKRGLFIRQYLVGRNIYFVPYYAQDLAIYNLDSGKMEYRPFGFETGLIYDALLIDQCLWAVQYNYPNDILQMELETGIVKTYRINWKQICSEGDISDHEIEKGEFDLTFCDVQYDNGYLWLVPFRKAGFIVLYNIKSQETVIHKIVGFERERFSSVAIDKSVIWLTFRDKPYILKLSKQFEVLGQIEYKEDVSVDNVELVKSVLFEDSIVIIKEKSIKIIDKLSKEIVCLGFRYCGEHRNYRIDGKELLIYSAVDGGGLSYVYPCEKRMQEEKVIWQMSLNENNMKKYFANQLWEGVASLDEYCFGIESGAETIKEKTASIGAMIWKNLKNDKI